MTFARPFAGGVGWWFFHGDRRGRSVHLPPNSAGDATSLVTLRNLLVRDAGRRGPVATRRRRAAGAGVTPG